VLCILGAVGSIPRMWRPWRPHRLLAGVAAVTTLIALILFATSFGNALAALDGLAVGTGGSLGTMQLATAILLCLSVAVAGAPQRAVEPTGAGSPPVPLQT
jgi:hypothetical protein